MRTRVASTALIGASLAAFAAVALPAWAAASHTLVLVSLAPKGTPWMAMLTDLETTIETNSGGRIDVQIKPPGTMSELDMVKAAIAGDKVQGAGVTTAAIAEAADVPTLQLVELPFLFDSDAEADHVLDHVLFDDMNPRLQAKGLVLASWSENGWRSFAAKGAPIRTPADVAAHKMRAQPSGVHVAMYEAYGAKPITMPANEVFLALKNGTVDGIDNTALYIQAGGIAEAIDSFTITRHIYQPAAVIFSKKWVDALPADLQAVVTNVRDVAPKSRTAIRAEEQALLDNFPLFGVDVITPTPMEREAFASQARAMHGSFAGTIDGGPELLAKIEAALATHRKAPPASEGTK